MTLSMEGFSAAYCKTVSAAILRRQRYRPRLACRTWCSSFRHTRSVTGALQPSPERSGTR